MSLHYLYRVIPCRTLLSTPRLDGQERFWTLCITKTLIFPQCGNKFAHITLLRGMLLRLRIWSSEAIFCHWSNAFWLVDKCPPLFPQRGLDFESRCFEVKLLVLGCAFSHSNSYGLAHMQFCARQKYFKNQWNFNNFTLRHVARNKIVIFTPRFSLILDMALFMLQFRDPFFDENWSVPILIRFTNEI